jgi:hypothetical protein
LSFILPGTSDYELRENGANEIVTIKNVEDFICLSFEHMFYNSVRTQVRQFRKGFEKVFPISLLKIFEANELEELLRGNSMNEEWTLDYLKEYVKPSYGYDRSR